MQMKQIKGFRNQFLEHRCKVTIIGFFRDDDRLLCFLVLKVCAQNRCSHSIFGDERERWNEAESWPARHPHQAEKPFLIAWQDNSSPPACMHRPIPLRSLSRCEKREQSGIKTQADPRSSHLITILNSPASHALRLPVAAERHSLVALPGGPARGHEPVLAVALADTAALAASGSEATHLAVLHGGPADPVDARVVADDPVRGVHTDDLVVLVHAVVGDPVRVEHTEVAATPANTLLGDVLDVAHELRGVDHTGLAGLAVDDTLVHGPLAVTTPHAGAEDGEALLGLVSEPVQGLGG